MQAERVKAQAPPVPSATTCRLARGAGGLYLLGFISSNSAILLGLVGCDRAVLLCLAADVRGRTDGGVDALLQRSLLMVQGAPVLQGIHTILTASLRDLGS